MLCTNFCLVVQRFGIVLIALHSSTPPIRIKWDGEPSGYVENTYNFNFSSKIGYIASLEWKR